MRRIFTICALSLASFLGVSAQTPADSAMIADAGWKQTVVANGVIAQEASFSSLYGVPQHVVIVRVLPDYGMLEVVRHNSFERTSEVAAQRCRCGYQRVVLRRKGSFGVLFPKGRNSD